MWVFWALFSVVAIVLILHMVKVERTRFDTHVTRCKAAADRLGVSYEQHAPQSLVTKLAGFDLTYADGAMIAERIRDVFTRARGDGNVHVFLHEFRSGAPQGGGATQRVTAGCIVSRDLRVPRFRLCPERGIEKLAAAVGMRDVDFDTHARFSASYFLNTADEAGTRALFRPEVLEFFENRPGMYVEGHGDMLLVYRNGEVLEPEELPRIFGTLDEVAQLLEGSVRAPRLNILAG
jgi:hypothetical protein